MGDDEWWASGPDPEESLPDLWFVESDWDPDGEWELPNVIAMDGTLVAMCETLAEAQRLCREHNRMIEGGNNVR